MAFSTDAYPVEQSQVDLSASLRPGCCVAFPNVLDVIKRLAYGCHDSTLAGLGVFEQCPGLGQVCRDPSLLFFELFHADGIGVVGLEEFVTFRGQLLNASLLAVLFLLVVSGVDSQFVFKEVFKLLTLFRCDAVTQYDRLHLLFNDWYQGCWEGAVGALGVATEAVEVRIHPAVAVGGDVDDESTVALQAEDSAAQIVAVGALFLTVSVSLELLLHLVVELPRYQGGVVAVVLDASVGHNAAVVVVA